MKSRKNLLAMILCIIMVTASGVQALASPQTVSPTTSTVIVNGTLTEFEAYLINDNNFFRLRDLAYALNGTNKQFSVGWDGAANAIMLTSGQPYEPIGGEMAQGDGTPQVATPTTSRVFINGVELNLTAYNISGNNFFRLRDIMRAFDIGVSWDAATSTIAIDTNTVYHGYGQLVAGGGTFIEADDDSLFFVDRLNLANLTLIPESVHILTPYDDPHGQWGDWDMYVWKADVRGVANLADIFVARQNLGNNNEHRLGLDTRGSDLVLSLVRLNDNGDLVGVMYLLPDNIAREARAIGF